MSALTPAEADELYDLIDGDLYAMKRQCSADDEVIADYERMAELSKRVLDPATESDISPKPTDEAWDRAQDHYREAGWDGDEGYWERLFWENGFRQGVAVARATPCIGADRAPDQMNRDHECEWRCGVDKYGRDYHYTSDQTNGGE